MTRKLIPLRERFERFLPADRPADSCWEWQGYRLYNGYGRIGEGGRDGRILYAHRTAWELHHSRLIPPGLKVCHHCDNPPCVNPSHLFLGTQKQNVDDMDGKGRRRSSSFRGQSHPGSRLSELQVIEIRALWAAGRATCTELARKFSVNSGTIHHVVNRKSWTHLP